MKSPASKTLPVLGERKIKGAGVAGLRHHFRKDPELEQKFLVGLSPEDQTTYQKTFPVSWIPMETASRLYEKAAALMYPGDSKGVQMLGIDLAKEGLSGIQKLFMSIITINFLVRQAARIYSNYIDQGQLLAEPVPGEKKIYLSLDNDPEMPHAIREKVNGFVWGAMEYAGAKNIKITRDDSNPMMWKWEVTWE
jgi:hypothetical protein